VDSTESANDILQSAGSSALYVDLKVRRAACADLAFKDDVRDDVRPSYARPNGRLEYLVDGLRWVVCGAAEVTTPALTSGSVEVVVEGHALVVEVAHDRVDESVEFVISDDVVVLGDSVRGSWSNVVHDVCIDNWHGVAGSVVE